MYDLYFADAQEEPQPPAPPDLPAELAPPLLSVLDPQTECAALLDLVSGSKVLGEGLLAPQPGAGGSQVMPAGQLGEASSSGNSTKYGGPAAGPGSKAAAGRNCEVAVEDGQEVDVLVALASLLSNSVADIDEAVDKVHEDAALASRGQGSVVCASGAQHEWVEQPGTANERQQCGVCAGERAPRFATCSTCKTVVCSYCKVRAWAVHGMSSACNDRIGSLRLHGP